MPLFCPEILKLDSLYYVILTIGIGFPIPIEFITDSDLIFAEDLEYFTNIQRVNVIFFYIYNLNNLA